MQSAKFRLCGPLQNKDSISSISTWRKKRDRRGTYWLKETEETCQLVAMNGILDPDSKKETVKEKKQQQIANNIYKTIRNLNTGHITDNIKK